MRSSSAPSTNTSPRDQGHTSEYQSFNPAPEVLSSNVSSRVQHLSLINLTADLVADPVFVGGKGQSSQGFARMHRDGIRPHVTPGKNPQWLSGLCHLDQPLSSLLCIPAGGWVPPSLLMVLPSMTSKPFVPLTSYQPREQGCLLKLLVSEKEKKVKEKKKKKEISTQIGLSKKGNYWFGWLSSGSFLQVLNVSLAVTASYLSPAAPRGQFITGSPAWNWRITVQLPCFPPPEGPGLPWVLVAGILR